MNEPRPRRKLGTPAILGLIAAPVVAYGLACVGLYVWQRRVLYNPQPRRNPKVPTMPLGVRDADVLVSIRPHEGPKAVVYFGGKSEDVSTTVPMLGEAFADASIYALHYRGFGGSAGTPSEAVLVADALALYDVVRKRHPHVVVVGRSLGSGIAIQVAARRRPRRLVLVTPYDSIAEVAAVHFRAFPTNWIVQDRFESWRVAPSIRVPTTVIVAEHDTVIPLAHTQRLLTHFRPGVVKLVLLTGEDHSSFLAKPAYYAALGASPRAAAGVHATTEHAPTLPLADVAAAEDDAASTPPADAADHAA